MTTRPAHRRHRAASSSWSSSSSSLSAASSSPAASSPSPRTTSVPFSWEHHPGIPKNCSPHGGADPVSSPRTLLPSPSPLRAPPSRRRSGHRTRADPAPADADPFATALAVCTRELAAGGNVIDIDALFRPTPASAAAAAATTAGRAVGSRRWSVATGGVVGFLDLYGCKSAMAVAEDAFVVRRPVAAAVAPPGGPGRAGRAGRR